MANRTSQHILSTAVNLLGFCLIILTSLHIADKVKNTFVDDATSIAVLCLTVSSVLSFLSIRTENENREYHLERIAEYFFLAALLILFSIILLLTFNYWNI